jgi:hypothetical protein
MPHEVSVDPQSIASHAALLGATQTPTSRNASHVFASGSHFVPMKRNEIAALGDSEVCPRFGLRAIHSRP